MRRSLCIDLGNSRVKLAIFHDKTLHNYSSFNYSDSNLVIEWLDAHDYEHIIYSSVVEPIPEWLIELKTRQKTLQLSSTCKLPIQLDLYETPETLGTDRIAALAGGEQLQLNAHLLIINAGSCMTYDLLHENGKFMGGNISPGLDMRYKAMHDFTSRLPLVHPLHPGDRFLGNNTIEAVENGSYFGLIFEIEAYFLRLSENYKGLKCVLTGGNAHKLVNRLKIDIFADPYLVLKGLNYILEINEST
ncbi:MAG: type III pantothenate kinase [Saprospiraceae bacterium]|nr:type III pantothenate kinase [Saprospiraceae bacterium]